MVAAAAAAAAMAVEMPQVAPMVVRIPAVEAEPRGPEGQSLVAVLVAVAEQEELVPPTVAEERVAAVVEVAVVAQ